MRYLFLLTNTAEDVAAWEGLDDDGARQAREAEMPRWQAFFEAAGDRVRSGLELEPPTAARTLRVRDGETVVTDGPFAETREQVGGYLVLECADLDEAIELAALVPVATSGSVEIRPLADGTEAGE